MNELALFAGAGGGILGGTLLGWRTVCAVELEPYARGVLVARQNDGCLPPFPIWDDVRTFDGRPWAGAIDVVSGGFPCQDTSNAGRRGGLDGAKSSLLTELLRIVGECQPDFVLIENSSHGRRHWLCAAREGLHGLGFDTRAAELASVDVGARHLRRRVWVAAYTRRGRHRLEEGALQAGRQVPELHAWRAGEPGVRRVDDGLAHRVDRLRAVGNGQDAGVVVAAWRLLTEQSARDSA